MYKRAFIKIFYVENGEILSHRFSCVFRRVITAIYQVDFIMLQLTFLVVRS